MDPGVTLYYTEEIWGEIYDRAKRLGKVKEVDKTAQMGYDYEYALLNPRDRYGRYRVSTEGEPYKYKAGELRQAIGQQEDEGSPGKSFAGYAFVFERLLPRPDFADYVGLHEWLEAEHVHKNKADRI
ncbi:MAG: hypothetical protein HY367_02815, partial [Candidatus Aenigmarchaeota archaeon]|nr:hypothetical protein [Candidatus Aenigmarchaeota archaeon]